MALQETVRSGGDAPILTYTLQKDDVIDSGGTSYNVALEGFRNTIRTKKPDHIVLKIPRYDADFNLFFSYFDCFKDGMMLLGLFEGYNTYAKEDPASKMCLFDLRKNDDLLNQKYVDLQVCEPIDFCMDRIASVIGLNRFDEIKIHLPYRIETRMRSGLKNIFDARIKANLIGYERRQYTNDDKRETIISITRTNAIAKWAQEMLNAGFDEKTIERYGGNRAGKTSGFSPRSDSRIIIPDEIDEPL